MNKPKLLLSGEAFIGEDGRLYETVTSYSEKMVDLSYKVATAIMKGDIQKPTIAISIPRGGLSTTEYMARALGIKGQHVFSCALSRYENRSRADKTAIGQLPTKGQVDGHWAIVAEDVADTGETLEEVQKILMDRGAAGVISAAVYWKQKCKEPDFWVSSTDPAQWIEFPSDPLEDFGKYFSEQMQLPADRRDSIK